MLFAAAHESGTGPNEKCQPGAEMSAVWVDRTYDGHHQTNATDPQNGHSDASYLITSQAHITGPAKLDQHDVGEVALFGHLGGPASASSILPAAALSALVKRSPSSGKPK
jgi:hypothetical protein